MYSFSNYCGVNIPTVANLKPPCNIAEGGLGKDAHNQFLQIDVRGSRTLLGLGFQRRTSHIGDVDWVYSLESSS